MALLHQITSLVITGNNALGPDMTIDYSSGLDALAKKKILNGKVIHWNLNPISSIMIAGATSYHNRVIRIENYGIST